MTIPFRFDIPSYDQAMSDFTAKVADGFLRQNGFISQMPVRRTVHAGPSRNVRSPQILDQSLKAFCHTMSIPFDIIRTTDIDALILILYEFADKYQQHVAALLIQGVIDVTEATGNTTDAQGKPLCFDRINDALEMLDISFDDQGQPLLPTMIMSTEMARKLRAIEPTPVELQRRTEILQRKKAAYDAQKRTRHLPR